MEAKDYVTAIRAHGFTQAQIADRTGIPQPTVSKIERGEVADVMSRNYRALQALHGELGAPVSLAPGYAGPERRDPNHRPVTHPTVERRFLNEGA